MAIKAIKRVKIGDQVFEQMKNMLISGEWKAGDKVPSETELAEQFGVSRVTVRQALQRLIALNLVETRVGEGSFVKEVDVSLPLDNMISVAYLEQDNRVIFEYRLILEVGSAKLAAKYATEEDIQKLRNTLQEMREAAKKDEAKEFSKLDLQFHYEIGEMTKNSLIIRTNSILREVLQHSMNAVIGRMGYTLALEYHEDLIRAIEAHDAEAAGELMQEHIRKNEDYFQE